MNHVNHPMLDFPEMDTQHDYLFFLYEKLLEFKDNQSNRSKLKNILDEIERYLLFHFTCEENLMRTYNYSGFAVHQGDHENSARKFISFLDDFEANRLNVFALYTFLRGWLEEHCIQSDTEYVKWINSKRESV